MSYEQCLEQSVAERCWCGHHRLEEATESVRWCRWTTFRTIIV